jgi:hypothetical protein
MTRTIEIHKAQIALMDGESLDQFSRALRDSLTKKFAKRPKAGASMAERAKSVEVWPREVFSERVVFEKWTPGEPGDRLFVATYKRDASTGEFTFEEPVPVREQRQYVPITKAAEDTVETLQLGVDKSFWSGLPLK